MSGLFAFLFTCSPRQPPAAETTQCPQQSDTTGQAATAETCESAAEQPSDDESVSPSSSKTACEVVDPTNPARSHPDLSLLVRRVLDLARGLSELMMKRRTQFAAVKIVLPQNESKKGETKKCFQSAWMADPLFRSWLVLNSEGAMTCRLCRGSGKNNNFTRSRML